MSNKLHIVYATDSRYLVPTTVAVASAVYWASKSSDLIIHVQDCGFSDEEWSEFCRRISKIKRASLLRHKIDMGQFDGYRIWNGSLGVYARLLIPEMLPDVDWCVYCDSDTLFVCDPFELVGSFDARYALIGHKDGFGKDAGEWFVEHGYPWCPDEYICAGFIIENLAFFRRNNLVEKSLRFIERENPPLNDQDALNVLCHGRIKQLNNGWGIFSALITPSDNPKCIHYAANQPWKVNHYKRYGLPDTIMLWHDFSRKVCGFSGNDYGAAFSRFSFVWCWVMAFFWRAVIWIAHRAHMRVKSLDFVEGSVVKLGRKTISRW